VHIVVVDLGRYGGGRLVLRVLVLRANAFARRAAEVLQIVLGEVRHGCVMFLGGCSGLGILLGLLVMLYEWFVLSRCKIGRSYTIDEWICGMQLGG
jgi:hypothetical protein